jgi:hypothetical protein
VLVGELPEESDQFHFLRPVRLENLKGSVVLILVKVSTMRVTIDMDLCTWSFIPLPCFFNSRLEHFLFRSYSFSRLIYTTIFQSGEWCVFILKVCNVFTVIGRTN